MFEEDERFKAVERPREREDLFENYIVEVHKMVLILNSALWLYSLWYFLYWGRMIESCTFVCALL
jgi:hypothetical protein